MMSGNRILFLFLALFLWKDANGLGVFLNRPANYYQSGGGSKSLGVQALSPAQQDFSSTASGIKAAVYDVGSVQPLSTSGSGASVANVPGLLWQYTIASDQNVKQYGPAPQSQSDYTALSSGTSGGLSLLPQSTTNQAAPGFQSQLVSSPVSSASQSLASQQSSFQLTPGQVTSLPQSFTANYVFGAQTQPSTPGTVSLNVASDFPTTSQQVGSGSQSAAGTVYGQPSSWYSFKQGQMPSQSVTTPYKHVSQSQTSASHPSSLQVTSPSQGVSSQPLTVPLSVASDVPTSSQQASYGYPSATSTLYGQASSVYSSTKGQSVKVPSADVPNTPVTVIGVYTAGPAQWYRINPFGSPSQTSKPLSPSQASGSQGSQAASSSFPTTSQSLSTIGIQSQTAPASDVSLTQSAAQLPSFQIPSGFSSTSFSAASPPASVSQDIPSSVTWSFPSLSTSQTQSTPGSFGFDIQSQTAPASAVSLTQNAAQLPSFQIPSGFSSTSFSASSPSASLSQPIQGGQSTLGSGVSTSFGQSSSGQVPPVATTQQYSSDVFPSTGFYGTFPSQVASTSQTSGNYGSTFKSSLTQVGSFDQYSPVSSPLSVTSTSAQGTPTNFGLVKGYSSQPYGFNPVFKFPSQSSHDVSVKN